MVILSRKQYSNLLDMISNLSLNVTNLKNDVTELQGDKINKDLAISLLTKRVEDLENKLKDVYEIKANEELELKKAIELANKRRDEWLYGAKH